MYDWHLENAKAHSNLIDSLTETVWCQNTWIHINNWKIMIFINKKFLNFIMIFMNKKFLNFFRIGWSWIFWPEPESFFLELEIFVQSRRQNTQKQKKQKFAQH